MISILKMEEVSLEFRKGEERRTSALKRDWQSCRLSISPGTL